MKPTIRIASAALFTCSMCCIAPVLLLLLGGMGFAAAFAELAHCYRDPLSLAIVSVVAFTLLILAVRRFRQSRPETCLSSPSRSRPRPAERTPQPLACTLLPADLHARLEELAALTRDALLTASRDDLTLILLFALTSEPRVRRMVQQEQQCCPFLTFDSRVTPNGFALRITAPETARAAVHEIYAHFLPS